MLQKPLALPPPMDNMWRIVSKIIDPLHIKNHRREACMELYNPSRVKEVCPDANLMQRGGQFFFLLFY